MLLNKKETLRRFFFVSEEYAMKYTYIIWDFNGTILNDVQVGIDSVNVLLSKRGIPQIASADEYRRVFGFPIIEYYKRIGFDFSKECFSDVAVEWVDEYMSRVKDAYINDGALEMLTRIKRNGMKNILVSATEINMLNNQLSMLGISELFDGVYGLDNIHAQNKIAAAKAWREHAPNAKALVVGDTDHDFQTAKAINADCVLYLGGHQSQERLSEFGCRLINSITELGGLL